MNDNNNIDLPSLNNNQSNTIPQMNQAQVINTEEIKKEESLKDNILQNEMVNDIKETAVKEASNMGSFFKDVFKYVTTRNSSELLQLVWRLILIALVIVVLYVPFQLARDLGVNIFIMFGVNITDKILNVWNSIWSILYGIIAIVLFFIICKDRFYKLIKSQQEQEKLLKEQSKN